MTGALRAASLLALLLSGCALERAGLRGTADGGSDDAGVDAPAAAADTGSPRDARSVDDSGERDSDAGGLDAEPPDDCEDGETQACGTDTGECVAGTRTCEDGRWGACEGGMGPRAEICNGLDDDCDGTADDEDADACDGPPGTQCLLGRDEGYCCMHLACAADPCCSPPAPPPCGSGWTCDHVVFAPEDCPPECAGQCGNCHMCVM